MNANVLIFVALCLSAFIFIGLVRYYLLKAKAERERKDAEPK